MSETTTTGRHRVPAVDGWYTMDDEPHLIGVRCTGCGTYVFPPRSGACPNPGCNSDELTETPLSRVGTVWSFTENRYAPPPPYKAAEPFEPYALVAVQLEKEGIIVLDVLYSETGDDGTVTDHIVYVWAPAGAKAIGEQK